MSRVNLGRVTMMPKGVWSSSLTYKRLDIVTNNGVSYIALQDVPANTVVTNTTYWMAVTPDISIGDVSTVSSYKSASASIGNDSSGKLKLNLSIPRGVSEQEDILHSESGSIVSFSDGIEAPAAQVKVKIEPVQEGSGDPSPDNVRPITGWTGMKVMRVRKNIYPVKIGADVWSNFQGGTYTNNNGELVVSMPSTLYSGIYSHTISSQIMKLSKMPVLASYSVDVKASEATSVWVGYENYGIKKFQIGTDYQRLTFTGIQFGTKTNFNIYNGTTSAVTVYLKDFQFELGSEVTSYEPYQGDTYDISFGEADTVYGGELDVTSGKLTVTHESIIFDGSEDEGWDTIHSGENTYVYQTKQFGIQFDFSNNSNNLKSNLYPWGDIRITTTAQGIWGNTEYKYIRVRWGTEIPISNWKANLASQPLQVCFTLVTPLTYQLTPTEVTTLLGQNNIWADTGDVDVSYFTEGGEGISKAFNNVSKSAKYDDDKTRGMLTQSSESIITASKNYTAGNFIIINNKLLRATANIASGGTITIGTNTEEVDLETVIAEKAEKILVAKLPFLSSADLYNNTADFHNAIPRGKDITAYLMDGSLWKRINGTNGYSLFEDLYVGDYLTAGGQQYMIVDFDYYIRSGSVDITQHHLVMMPSGRMNIPAGTILHGSSEMLAYINTANAGVTVTSEENETNKKWNATMEAPNTNSTNGGYKFSRMRQVIMRAADTIVINAFGTTHVKPITVWYPNPADAATSSLASDAAWFANDDWTAPDRKSICDLPNETQIYGQQVWGRGSVYTNLGYEIGTDKWQFSLFRYNRNRANIRASWWLRSVVSASGAASVGNPGYAYTGSASAAFGVRPRFLLVG